MERPLDGFERRYWLLGMVCPYTFSAIAHVRGTLDPGAVQAALHAAQQRHPMLRIRIDARKDGPWFVDDAPPLELRVLDRPDDAAWEAVVEEHDNATYPARGPLWRAALLRGPERSDLVLSFHHLLCDGLASHVAMRDVLTYAAQAADREPGQPSLPLPRGMCALLPPEARGPAGQAALQALVKDLEHLKASPPARLAAERMVPPAERRTRIVHRRLDPATTGALAARARKENTSVTGALAAAHLLTLAEEVGVQGPSTFGLSVPANLRPALVGPDAEAVDWYAFGVPLFPRAGPGVGFWDLARDVRTQLADPRLPLVRYAVLAHIDATTPRSAEGAAAEVQAAEGFGLTAGTVSNLGRLPDLPAVGDAVVEGFHVTGNQNLGGPTFLQVPTTYQGTMFLDFHHAEPLISRSRAKRLADGVVERARAALG